MSTHTPKASTVDLVPVRRALVSVYDKTGVVEFCRVLAGFGCEILSTGGTAKSLRDAGIAVKDVSDHTGFPEMMDGRVKTLHPKIHGGLLALRDNDAHMAKAKEHGIGMIDMVVCNLYPFEATVAKPGVTREEAVEQIDIGGPSMVRSCAKNHAFTAVVTGAGQYECLVEELKANGGALTKATRRGLATAAFAATAKYDAAIAEWMAGQDAEAAAASAKDAEDAPGVAWPGLWMRPYTLVQGMRYGENPHQHAAFFADPRARGTSLARAKQLNGKALSYNNLLDADGALRLVLEFGEPAAVVVKHNTPCGCALGKDAREAFVRAYDADPVSAFGGIVALNRPCDEAVAAELTGGSKFLEVVLAPSFSKGALEMITGEGNPNKWRKSIRLLELGEMAPDAVAMDVRGVVGGVLVQTRDFETVADSALKVVTREKPSEATMRDLHFAWRVVKHVKSNAIVVAAQRQMLGAGGGQTSRVSAVKIALSVAGTQSHGAVLASDAFFPFPDSIELAAAAGISAIIQPGGSVKDKDVIAACDRAGISMVLTGMRHFRH